MKDNEICINEGFACEEGGLNCDEKATIRLSDSLRTRTGLAFVCDTCFMKICKTHIKGGEFTL